MPGNKRPSRKKGKGKSSKVRAIIQRIKAENYKSLEQFKGDLNYLKKLDNGTYLARFQMNSMIALTTFDEVRKGFLRSLSALNRWPTTTEAYDFNVVTSSLMLGVLIFHMAKVAETEILQELQHAAFMCVVCARIRNNDEVIPEANIKVVREGLALAQDLMEAAYNEDRQAFISALKENTVEYLEAHPEAVDAHMRMALGKNYERVQEWEKENATIWELQNTRSEL